MNKEEFTKFISEKESITKKDASSIIDSFVSSVTAALRTEKDIALTGFGAFSVSHIAARNGRHPKTGAPMVIKAHKQVKFKAGKNLKDSCNEGL